MSETSTQAEQGTEVDVVVVGLGPGGESVASELAGAGLEVVGIDRRLVGGECPYFGCIPSKMMIHAAHTLAEGGRVPGVAGDASVTPSWSPVARRISEEATSGWDDAVAVDRLVDAGVRFVRGDARLVGPRTVEVGGERIVARRGVVLNTGTDPAVLPIDGLADTPYWTNRDAVQLTELPGSLAVIGGGPIGAELAQTFARFGVLVTVLEASDRILGPEEPEASEVVTASFLADGVRVRTGVSITRVDHADGRFTLTLDGDEPDVTADKLLVTAGRRPNLPDLGLESVGLDPDAHAVEVDEWMRAGGPDAGLWAIGDITGKGAYTHTSMYQADVAVRSILDRGGEPARYHAMPHVTFTDPEVGGVGLTEQKARDAGIDVVTTTADLGSSTRGWIAQAPGVAKLVADRQRGVLVGATAVGPSGGEVLSMLALAVHAEVPVASLGTLIWAYPTFHRGLQPAVDELVGRLSE